MGFADIWIEKWGVELRQCALFEKNGARWVNPPARPYKQEDGTIKHAPTIYFPNKEHYEAFCDQVKTAVDNYLAKIEIEDEDKEGPEEPLF